MIKKYPELFHLNLEKFIQIIDSFTGISSSQIDPGDFEIEDNDAVRVHSVFVALYPPECSWYGF